MRVSCNHSFTQAGLKLGNIDVLAQFKKRQVDNRVAPLLLQLAINSQSSKALRAVSEPLLQHGTKESFAHTTWSSEEKTGSHFKQFWQQARLVYKEKPTLTQVIPSRNTNRHLE